MMSDIKKMRAFVLLATVFGIAAPIGFYINAMVLFWLLSTMFMTNDTTAKLCTCMLSDVSNCCTVAHLCAMAVSLFASLNHVCSSHVT